MKNIFAYHKIHEHGKFNGEWYKTNSPNNVNIGDIIYILSGNTGSGTNGSHKYYLEGKYKIDRFEVLSDGRKLLLDGISVPDKPIILNDKNDFNKESFRNRFASGQSCTTVPENFRYFFDTLLDKNRAVPQISSLETDIENIFNVNITDTEKEQLIKARIGQGVFRGNVKTTWGMGEVCALTLVNIPELLIASHIKAWKDCTTKEERLDGSNGLLLCSHIDALFDRHLVTFIKSGREYILEVNKTLDKKTLSGLGIIPGQALCTTNFRKLNMEDFERFELYMSYHNETFQQLRT